MSLQIKVMCLLVLQLKVSLVLCKSDQLRSVSWSVVSMEKLLKVEEAAMIHLESYAKQLERKINILESSLERWRQENEKSRNDEEAYLSNPINALSLMHRLRFEWFYLDSFAKQVVGVEDIVGIHSQLFEMPLKREFSEAVNGINVLQSLHHITAKDMANGILNGKKYSAKLSWVDSFALAQNMFDEGYYEGAREWIEEALRAFNASSPENVFKSNQCDLHALHGEIQLKLGNIVESIAAMEEALSFDPLNTELNKRYNELELGFETASSEEQVPLNRSDVIQEEDHLCHDGFPPRVSNLHCRLLNDVNAFVRLAPFKMEEISFDPYVVKFYDILSDKDISHIKEISQENLKRAQVFDENADTSVAGNFRRSQVAWLENNRTEIVSRINRRVADVTGFELDGAENLQVVSYGIAGYYTFHYDFFGDVEIARIHDEGDRLATVLIYMSDVAAGGETVFPSIGASFKPQKGTAILWYNVDHKGDPDYNVGHIACPVVVGSKWVLTKWFTVNSQFRSRPCQLV